MSHEALHDEEPDQIEGNYIVVGHPVPLWQPKKFIWVGEIFLGCSKLGFYLVATSVTIIWSRENSYDISVMTPIIPFHHKLMGT